MTLIEIAFNSSYPSQQSIYNLPPDGIGKIPCLLNVYKLSIVFGFNA